MDGECQITDLPSRLDVLSSTDLIFIKFSSNFILDIK